MTVSDPTSQALNDSSSAVVSLYRSEEKIYPRHVSGWFSRWRWSMVWLTQLVFYGLPWLNLHDRPALLFDLLARRFYIFHWVLYPQDLIYLTGLLVLSALSLFLFSAVAGRLWCGYACPQTVYTEIFMAVERWVEGDRSARMRLDDGRANVSKISRKTLKHALWLLIGLWTGFTFVGYFTPIRALADEVMRGALGPWELFWIVFYGLATYGNAGWMREQVCKYMCPYARFQSAMFDKDTWIVSYDPARGEGRGARARHETPAQYQAKGLGDCIDCGLCVQVCPTGIDIRKGLQYECICCAACVDVCDTVMEKMHYPKGLIRYSTQNGVSQKLSHGAMLRRIFRPRIWAYSALLLAVMVITLYGLWHRASFKVDVVRDRSIMARRVGQGAIENVYRLQVMNATEQLQHYGVRVVGLAGAEIASAPVLDVDAAHARWLTVRVQAPSGHAGSYPMAFIIANQDERQETVSEKSVFVIPHDREHEHEDEH